MVVVFAGLPRPTRQDARLGRHGARHGRHVRTHTGAVTAHAAAITSGRTLGPSRRTPRPSRQDAHWGRHGACRGCHIGRTPGPSHCTPRPSRHTPARHAGAGVQGPHAVSRAAAPHVYTRNRLSSQTTSPSFSWL